MKILVTGAHFTTALAVIEELKGYPDVEIVYVGRKFTREGDSTPSIESQLLPQRGVKFISLTTGRLQRVFTLYTITSLLKIPVGFVQAFYILLKENPNVVLSFGGYVSVPIVILAWIFSKPIIIHEQTLVSGLANRIGALFADKMAISFAESKLKGKKIILTGNPIREEILQPKTSLPKDYQDLFRYAKKNKLPVILVTGGNQGSHTINQAVEGCLDKLLTKACVIHQTGESKFQDFERLLNAQSERYLVKKWIGEEIGAVLSQVDLVVSRAGANTLTELAFLGKPALVIPLPYLYHDEQNKNAKFFEKLGLVGILPQPKLTPQTLYEQVLGMVRRLDRWQRVAQNAKQVVMPDAANIIALETVLLAV